MAETPKIGIAAICKNEEHLIGYFISSLLELGFEEFIITDTGSTDNTKQIIKSFNNPNIKLFEGPPGDSNFADFRSTMWANVLVHAKSKYVLVLDIDEMILNMTHDEISKFVNDTFGKSYFINRFDISDNDVTALKRLLKVDYGMWSGRIHEHFTFNSEQEPLKSDINVVHIHTERIKSKNKLLTYRQLINTEKSKKYADMLFYFRLVDAFGACDVATMDQLWDEFDHFQCGAFFNELILHTFYKLESFLGDNAGIQMVFDKAEKLGIKENVIKRATRFEHIIAKTNNKQMRYPELNKLGKPVTYFFEFSNVNETSKITAFATSINIICKQEVDKLQIIKDQNRNVTLRVEANNDIAFNQKIFGGFLKFEIIQLIKYCLKNKITRETYYEQ